MCRFAVGGVEPGHGLDVVDRAAAVLGDRLGWSEDRRASEIAEYRDWLTRLQVPIAAATSGVMA